MWSKMIHHCPFFFLIRKLNYNSWFSWLAFLVQCYRDMSFNKLTGSVPSSFQNLTLLQYLWVVWFIFVTIIFTYCNIKSCCGCLKVIMANDDLIKKLRPFSLSQIPWKQQVEWRFTWKHHYSEACRIVSTQLQPNLSRNMIMDNNVKPWLM